MPRGTTRTLSGTRGTRGTRGRTPTGAPRLPSLRLTTLFAVYYVALVLATGWGGAPVGVRQGMVAPADRFARGDFSYRDDEQTERRRQEARLAVPGHYARKAGWVAEIMADVETLFAALREAADEAGLRARLQEAGITVECGPLYALKSQRGSTVAGQMLERVRSIVERLGKSGILSDRNLAEEEGRGRATVLELTAGLPPNASIGGRPLSIGSEAVSLEAARRLLVRWLDDLLAEFPTDAVNVVKGILLRAVHPNLAYAEEASERARAAAARRVPPIETQVRKGELLVRKGSLIDDAAFRKILEEEKAYRQKHGLARKVARWAGVLALVAAVLIPMVLLISHFEAAAWPVRRRLLSLSVGALLVVLLSRVFGGYLYVPSLAPVGLFGLACGMVFPLGTAAVAAIGTTILSAAGMGEGVGFVAATAAGTLAGILSIRQAARRSSVLTTGALAGGVYMAGLLGWELMAGSEDLLAALTSASFGLLNGLVSGAVLVGLTPVVEYLFAATTRISLLELSDQEHPALRDLLLRAPGTYHHSLILGNIAEACARGIGADALFARVACYYHDIGKMTKPEYFVENQPPGRSPHESLSPSMSALVIVSHVKDGVDLAAEYRLPKPLRDVIEEHHGTTLVEFFYRRALEQQEDRKGRISQRLFRYPGPLPQTREAALVMLADSVEAASRSLEEPGPAHIDNLVSGIIQRRLIDGQLDESDLTFRDLRQVKETMVRVLGSMYHSRPKYPGQDEKQDAEGGRREE